MICPCCLEEVEPEHFACKMGSKGGKNGTGEVKARTSEQARKAADARWHKKTAIVNSEDRRFQNIEDSNLDDSIKTELINRLLEM